MNKIFAEMFSKEPFETIDGDYFYYNPYCDNEEIRENSLGNTFKSNWEKRSRDDFSPFMIWSSNYEMTDDGTYKLKIIDYKFSEMKEIFKKIAAEDKPFIDISSSVSWGLVPFIAKINPKIPCMVTDIHAPDIRCYRKYINRYMTEYNINLASFDNYDMPIKDNSLDYVTSTGGIGGSSDGANAKIFGNKKVISEVYRILKPGGCYVTLESSEWHDQFMAVGFQAEIRYSEWYDRFAAEGFPAEVENYHSTTFYVLRKPI